jgi:hypothetical protein
MISNFPGHIFRMLVSGYEYSLELRLQGLFLEINKDKFEKKKKKKKKKIKKT